MQSQLNNHAGNEFERPAAPLEADAATPKHNLQQSRATELFLWSLPPNQSYAGRDAMFKASGGDMMDVVYIGGFADHTKKLSTPNAETDQGKGGKYFIPPPG